MYMPFSCGALGKDARMPSGPISFLSKWTLPLSFGDGAARRFLFALRRGCTPILLAQSGQGEAVLSPPPRCSHSSGSILGDPGRCRLVRYGESFAGEVLLTLLQQGIASPGS